MKMVYPDYNFQIVFYENKINTLTIENHSHLVDIIGELCSQINGEEGRFVLSEELEIIKISGGVELIINPFDLNINDKKIITKLYKSMDIQMMDNHLLVDLLEIQSMIFKLLGDISMQNDFNLEYNDSIALLDLLKMSNVKIESESNSFFEKICEYMKAFHLLQRTKLFIFVHLKQYLNNDEINSFLDFIFYHKMNVLLIESYKSECLLKEEINYVVDKDLCDIY